MPALLDYLKSMNNRIGDEGATALEKVRPDFETISLNLSMGRLRNGQTCQRPKTPGIAGYWRKTASTARASKRSIFSMAFSPKR